MSVDLLPVIFILILILAHIWDRKYPWDETSPEAVNCGEDYKIAKLCIPVPVDPREKNEL